MILYCKFYLNTDLPIEMIEEIIENSLEKSSFDYLDMRISCFKNTVRNGNDFTYWPYYLDFEPIDDDNYNDKETFMLLAKNLFDILKKERIETVVACDFEDEFKG